MQWKSNPQLYKFMLNKHGPQEYINYIYGYKYIYMAFYVHTHTHTHKSFCLPQWNQKSVGLIHAEDLTYFNYFYCLDELIISTILNLIHSVELIKFVISMMNKMNHSPWEN